MTTHQSPRSADHRSGHGVDLFAAAVLFVCVVSLVLGLVEVSRDDASPFILVPGMIFGAAAITRVRHT